MNHQNQIQIQQRHGDSNSDFGNRSSVYLNINQPSNMAGAGGVHQHPPYAAVPTAKSPTSSTTIMSRFESPASAFYATERCMGLPLPQYDDSQLVNPNPNLDNPSFTSHFSRLNDSEFPLYQSDPTFLLSNTLQAMVKPQFTPPPSHPYKGNQDHTVGLIGSYNLHVDHHLNFSCNQDKLSPTLSSPASVSTTTVSGSNGTVVSSKTRIRWTQDLHDKFVECVNRLGGAEKATPKAILKLMDSDGLTIFHVKSHLQKYRIAKYMPDSAQGKSDKRTHVEEDVHRLDAKTGLQIREALQLQLDVQRRLHEQLEIQRKLQLRIEEQGRQLKMMFDQQQKTSNDLLNTQNLSSTTNDDDASNSIKDVDSFFPSKIS